MHGCCVGNKVGIAVGLKVGAAVGKKVGVAVGAPVGDAVLPPQQVKTRFNPQGVVASVRVTTTDAPSASTALENVSPAMALAPAASRFQLLLDTAAGHHAPW
jgi:hypothetical protein